MFQRPSAFLRNALQLSVAPIAGRAPSESPRTGQSLATHPTRARVTGSQCTLFPSRSTHCDGGLWSSRLTFSHAFTDEAAGSERACRLACFELWLSNKSMEHSRLPRGECQTFYAPPLLQPAVQNSRCTHPGKRISDAAHQLMRFESA